MATTKTKMTWKRIHGLLNMFGGAHRAYLMTEAGSELCGPMTTRQVREDFQFERKNRMYRIRPAQIEKRDGRDFVVRAARLEMIIMAGGNPNRGNGGYEIS